MKKMKRPLSWMGFSAAAAFLFAGWVGPLAAGILLTAGFAGAMLSLAVPRLRAVSGLAAVSVTVCVAMGLFLYKELAVYRPLEAYAGQTLAVKAEITGEPTVYERSARYPATVVGGEIPEDTPLYIWVTDADFAPQPFDMVEARIKLFPLEEDRAQRLQDKAGGVLLSGSLQTYDGADIIRPEKTPPGAALLTVRQAAGQVVNRYLSGVPAAMVRAICLGDRDGLPESTLESFRSCGVSHLLVVSGLHLGMVAAAMRWLLRRLRLGRRLTAVLSMVGVLGFMLLTGFSPSVKRAGVMLLVLLAGDLFKREADGLNSLGLALLLMGLLNPFMVWDVGLQLSAGSTWGILYLYPRIEKCLLRPRVRDNARGWVRVAYHPLQAAALSLSAMAILPLLAVYFGDLSLVFLPANLLMVFPATCLVVAGLLGVLLGGWFAPAGTLLFGAAGGIARLLQTFARWLGGFSWSTVSIRQPYLWVWAALTVLVLCLFWKRASAPARVAIGAGSVMALALGALTYHAAMRPVTTCTFLETTGGTAALIRWESGNILVLSGDEASLISETTSALSRAGVRSLSAVVLPDLEDKALQRLTLLADACPAEQVICPSTGLYAPAVKSLFPETGRAMADTVEAAVGDDHRIQMQRGWVRISAGETRFLFCPEEGDASALPADWRKTHLAVMRAPVAHADEIEAVAGISSVPRETLQPCFTAVNKWVDLPENRSLMWATGGKQDICLNG